MTPEALLRRLEEKEAKALRQSMETGTTKSREQQLKERERQRQERVKQRERALKEREKKGKPALNSENEKGSSKSGVEVVAKAIIYTKHK